MSLSVRPFVVSTIDSHLSMHSPPHRLVNPQPVLDWLQTIETTSSSRHWTVVNLTRSQLWADKLELRGGDTVWRKCSIFHGGTALSSCHGR